MPKAFDLKPLTFGDILGRSFSLLTTGFLPILRWTLLFWTLPVVLTTLALHFLFDPYGGPFEQSRFDGGTYTAYVLLRTVVEMTLGFSLLAAGVSFISARLYVGDRPGLLEVVNAIRARINSVVGTGLLHGLCILAITVILFIPSLLALAEGDGWAAAGAATLSLMVWVPLIGVYLGFFGLNLTCVMLDDSSSIESFGRSRQLSKGFRMRLFALLTVVLLVFGAPGVWGLLMVPGMLVDTMLADTNYRVLGDLALVLWQSLLVPVFFMAPVVYFFDMRSRLEGYDLAVMARNFGIEEGEMEWYRMNPHAGYSPDGHKQQRRPGSGRRRPVKPARPISTRLPRAKPGGRP
jgi:hypothetical protein